MQNLPKIVRDRMTTAPPVTHHPDADVLTAFAEKSLSALERDSVLEHLGHCRECRDVVALALPEIDTQTVVARPRTAWLSWPVMRWGLAAAGIVVVASVGILRYQQNQQMSLASKQAANLEVATSVGPTQPITNANPTHTEMQEEAKDKAFPKAQGDATGQPETRMIAPKDNVPQAPNRVYSNRGSVAGVVGGAISNSGARFGPSPSANWQNNAQLQNDVQSQQKKLAMPQVRTPMPAPQRSPTNDQGASMASNMRSPAPNPEAAAQDAAVATYSQDTLQAKAAPPSAPLDYSRAKEPVLGAENAVPQPSEPGPETQDLPVERAGSLNGRNFTQLAALVAMPRWTISPTGSLQRTLDQGKTWQDVDVRANMVPSASGASLALSAQFSSDKQKLAEMKIPGPPAAPLIFRAVTAIGLEVWAGGTNAALFHSIDAGSHWTRVLPQSAGVVPTGDIVSVQFADGQHGRILTSTAETWTTSDAGQTWQKQ